MLSPKPGFENAGVGGTNVSSVSAIDTGWYAPSPPGPGIELSSMYDDARARGMGVARPGVRRVRARQLALGLWGCVGFSGLGYKVEAAGDGCGGRDTGRWRRLGDGIQALALAGAIRVMYLGYERAIEFAARLRRGLPTTPERLRARRSACLFQQSERDVSCYFRLNSIKWRNEHVDLAEALSPRWEALKR